MTRRCPDIVFGAALVARVADKDALTILMMMFASHQRAPFSIGRENGKFQDRMDAAMDRLCALGCIERLERDRFRIVEKEIRTLDECLAPLAAVSPVWGHA